ncbi:MAG: hypothetical protein CVU11_02020 [Bacteroidetes bacterium HGW-Bacteroidetes-6]|jgi:hypothetical protein|nr:MAG: hypothetical protein CVU11_02020 [Bacteroidetes bacterium HGW-Bacteroidetes-6]
MRKSVLILLAAGLFSCNSLNVSQVDSNSKIKHDGFFYYLPKTVVHVDVTVKETHFLKGPFSQFSAKFTGISNVITENSFEYSIESVDATPASIPDTSKLYYIDSHSLKNRDDFGLWLTANGCIGGLNLSKKERTDGSPMMENGSRNIGASNSEFEAFEYFATGNTRVKTDTIFEKIILDTITIEKQILQHSIIEKSLEDKAKDAADYIKLISENRMNLIAGYQEVDYNQATFERMLAELDDLMQEYMTLFTGKKIENTYHYRFTIVPENAMKNNSRFLFSFFTSEGIGNEPDSLFVDNMYYYRLVPGEKSIGISKALSNSKLPKKKGLAYNIPEEATLVIEKGSGEVMFSAVIPVCQYGITAFLPTNLRQVKFKPETGSVEYIER